MTYFFLSLMSFIVFSLLGVLYFFKVRFSTEKLEKKKLLDKIEILVSQKIKIESGYDSLKGELKLLKQEKNKKEIKERKNSKILNKAIEENNKRLKEEYEERLKEKHEQMARMEEDFARKEKGLVQLTESLT